MRMFLPSLESGEETIRQSGYQSVFADLEGERMAYY